MSNNRLLSLLFAERKRFLLAARGVKAQVSHKDFQCSKGKSPGPYDVVTATKGAFLHLFPNSNNFLF